MSKSTYLRPGLAVVPARCLAGCTAAVVRAGTAAGTALLADPEVRQAIVDFLGGHDA